MESWLKLKLSPCPTCTVVLRKSWHRYFMRWKEEGTSPVHILTVEAGKGSQELLCIGGSPQVK